MVTAGRTVVKEIPGGRLSDGTFAKGNKLTPKGNGHHKRLAHFFSLATEEHVEAVYNRVLALCLHSDDDKVSLAACELYLNRIIGKVKEESSIEVVNTAEVPDALMVLRQLMNRQEEPIKLP